MNLDRVEDLRVDGGYGKCPFSVYADLPTVDKSDAWTVLFDGTQEECQAVLDTIQCALRGGFKDYTVGEPLIVAQGGDA